MKIGIMGAGAIGCYVGGRLVHAGIDTVLVGRAALASELRSHGIHLSDYRKNDVHVPEVRVEPSPSVLEASDVVLVTVKGGDTVTVGETLAQVLRPETLIVSLQNGVKNADMLRRSLKNPVLAAMVPFNVLRTDGGHFHQGTSGTLVIQSGPGARAIADVLNAARIPTELDPAIEEILWGKLLVNLNNAVNALSGVPIKTMLAQRGYRRIMAACVREGLDALRRAKIRPRYDLKLPFSLVPYSLGLPDALFSVFSRAMPYVDPHARSSMWDDLTRGRKTEVDALNGEIVALAAAHGARAPVNEAIVRLVHDAERTGCPNLSADALRLSVFGG